MQSLKERLEQLKQQLSEWEAQSPRNQNKIDAITAEIARVTEQLKETVEREQKTGELLDEYNDTLNTIYDALWPESVYAKALGVNEYNEKRSDFKKVMSAYYSEKIAVINAEHGDEINGWREKVERLTAQTQEAESKVSESKQQIEQREKELAELIADKDAEVAAYKTKCDELEKIIENGKAANAALVHENGNYRDQVAELQAKIEQATKPKVTTPSESLNQVLESVKARQPDPDEFVRRFEARQNGGNKVMKIDHSKQLAIPELPYAQTAEVAAPVMGQSATIPTVEDNFPIEGDQPSGLPVLDDGADTRMADEAVTRAEFEALKADVEALKRRSGMVA